MKHFKTMGQERLSLAINFLVLIIIFVFFSCESTADKNNVDSLKSDYKESKQDTLFYYTEVLARGDFNPNFDYLQQSSVGDTIYQTLYHFDMKSYLHKLKYNKKTNEIYSFDGDVIVAASKRLSNNKFKIYTLTPIIPGMLKTIFITSRAYKEENSPFKEFVVVDYSIEEIDQNKGLHILDCYISDSLLDVSVEYAITVFYGDSINKTYYSDFSFLGDLKKIKIIE